MNVLLHDGDATRRQALAATLTAMGFAVSARDGVARSRAGETESAVLALVALDAGCVDLIARLRREDPLRPVVVLTDCRPDAETTTMLGRVRAHDVLIVREPADLKGHGERLRVAGIRKAARQRLAPVAGDLVGASSKLAQMRRYIERAAKSDASVLILGESGTGKEIVARAIHRHSARAEGPFVPVNCAAIPDTLLESDLFGHERGAFTGADKRVRGKFEQAHGGTLFFDEIAEMPMALQAKLLRVLQPPPGVVETTREITRVGSEVPITVDVRLAFATHRDLAGYVKDGRFREDLHQRLNVIRLQVPALREHREDIPELARHFLARAAKSEGLEPLDFDPLVLDVLSAHDWPLNVRELEALVRSLVVLKEAGSTIVFGDLPSHLFGAAEKEKPAHVQRAAVPRTLREVEEEHVRLVLAHTRGNKSQAARLLGISRPALDRKLAGPEVES